MKIKNIKNENKKYSFTISINKIKKNDDSKGITFPYSI